MLDLGGTYRAVTPEETLARLDPLLWDIFGITRVANITGLDSIDIPTYTAIRPESLALTTSQGKGITKDLAKVSAIMESIEIWHSERIPPAELYGSYEQLKQSYSLVDVTQDFEQGPMQFFHGIENVEMAWAKGVNLLGQEEVYFPYSLIDLNFAKSNELEQCFMPSSNGLASGNTLIEATCHALFEVIERDCNASAESGVIPQKLVDLDKLESAHLCELMDRINSQDIILRLYDITNDLGVPAFSATLSDPHAARSLGCFGGHGAHLSSVVAASRAITEAVQSRATVIAGSRDDLFPNVYAEKSTGVSFVESEKTYPFLPTNAPATFDEMLENLLSILQQAGYKQIIRYNHTRPEVGIPVVHTIIPGMQFNYIRHMKNV